MNNVSEAKTCYLLEIDLEALHKQSRAWLSEIDFWRTELHFYQKLLEKIARNNSTTEVRKKIDHFQNLIIYYQGELLDQYEHDIREHDKRMKNMMQDSGQLDEKFYREEHQKYEELIWCFNFNFKEYRKQLYEFAVKD